MNSISIRLSEKLPRSGIHTPTLPKVGGFYKIYVKLASLGFFSSSLHVCMIYNTVDMTDNMLIQTF